MNLTDLINSHFIYKDVYAKDNRVDAVLESHADGFIKVDSYSELECRNLAEKFEKKNPHVPGDSDSIYSLNRALVQIQKKKLEVGAPLDTPIVAYLG